jgi:hypothetical protein
VCQEIVRVIAVLSQRGQSHEGQGTAERRVGDVLWGPGMILASALVPAAAVVQTLVRRQGVSLHCHILAFPDFVERSAVHLESMQCLATAADAVEMEPFGEVVVVWWDFQELVV